MSNLYRNNSGLLRASGPVTSISPDRTAITVKVSVYNVAAHAWENPEYTIKSALPFDESFVVGAYCTCVGYQAGMGVINAQFAAAGKGYYEEGELGFLQGEVVKCGLNEEKNPDGSPKINRAGNPRKRHFDIFVKTVDMNGEEELHIVKVYDGNPQYIKEGEKSPLEKAMARFKPFTDENKSAVVSIVTGKADSYSYEKEFNGQVTVVTNHSHMGFKSLDISFGAVRENTRTAENARTEEAKTESVPAPAPAEQESPADALFASHAQSIADVMSDVPPLGDSELEDLTLHV